METIACNRSFLTIAAVTMSVLLASANAELINVNLDFTARTQSSLDGPIFGTGGSDVGTTWNQILAGPGGIGGRISATNLQKSTGAASTMDFTSDAQHLYPWNAPDINQIDDVGLDDLLILLGNWLEGIPPIKDN